MGKFDDAERDFERGEELNPNLQYGPVAELQPNLALARDLLGRLDLQGGKTEEAIEQSRLAFQQDPTDQTALYHLILALRRGNRSAEVPPLARKLAALLKQTRAKEAAEHKYSLVEVTPPQK